MAQPYIGEIRLFAGNFAPAGWAFCDGQLVSISENPTLFQLIGTTYGGDGQTTFALPDLRSRVPVHMGQGSGLSNYTIGQSGGTEESTLTVSQIPSHAHAWTASTDLGSATNPISATTAQTRVVAIYRDIGIAAGSFAANSVQAAGGSQPHSNLQPILAISFIISLFGIFPSQT
jgi:microcystin-dependent protein